MPPVRIHPLFDYLLKTTDAAPQAFVGFSLSRSPRLGDFLADLDPDLPLDWNGTSFQGLPALRAHVLEQAGLTGICHPNDVLITAGAAEANYLVMRQLLSPGDHIVTETPGWPQVGVLADAIGATLTAVPRHEADHWHLDPDAIARAVNPATKLIFLTNPNNPTGQIIPPEDLARIAAIADRAGAWLLVDEVYAGLEWTAPRAPSAAGLSPRGITTGSVSKALGLQGLRTGWIICRDATLIRDALILRENSSEIMNILGEVIAEIALRPDRLSLAIATARAEGRANLAILDRFIAASPLSWIPPQGGLIGLARLPAHIASDDLARRLLAPPWRTFLLPAPSTASPAISASAPAAAPPPTWPRASTASPPALPTGPGDASLPAPPMSSPGAVHATRLLACPDHNRRTIPMQTIVKLPPTSASEPSTADLDGWVVTEGTPSMKTWVLHTSAAGDMISGIWECTVGSYHATYTAYEYVVLIAGRITITPDGGTPVTVRAGDAFVVDPTFKGTWKIEENVRKHFDLRVG